MPESFVHSFLQFTIRPNKCLVSNECKVNLLMHSNVTVLFLKSISLLYQRLSKVFDCECMLFVQHVFWNDMCWNVCDIGCLCVNVLGMRWRCVNTKLCSLNFVYCFDLFFNQIKKNVELLTCWMLKLYIASVIKQLYFLDA